MTDNVLAFVPRRPEPARLEACEIQMHDDFTVELRAYDTNGDLVVSITYAMAGQSPEDFDLDRLRAAWAAWRDGGSSIAR